jgi:hypothetical protein
MRPAKLIALLTLITIALCASDARAQEPSGRERALYEQGGLLGTGLVLGLKVGAGFGQPFGDLGTSYIPELELGYALPVLDRSLELFVSGAYTAPKAEGTLSDDRLPSPVKYSLTQQQALVTLGLLYRVPLSTKWFRPYLAAGPRLFAMRTEAKGNGGSQPFGKNEETSTKVGVFAALGGELHVGPGALLLEVSLSWAKVDGYVLRKTSAGALGLSLGYRFFM